MARSGIVPESSREGPEGAAALAPARLPALPRKAEAENAQDARKDDDAENAEALEEAEVFLPEGAHPYRAEKHRGQREAPEDPERPVAALPEAPDEDEEEGKDREKDHRHRHDVQMHEVLKFAPIALPRKREERIADGRDEIHSRVEIDPDPRRLVEPAPHEEADHEAAHAGEQPVDRGETRGHEVGGGIDRREVADGLAQPAIARIGRLAEIDVHEVEQHGKEAAQAHPVLKVSLSQSFLLMSNIAQREPSAEGRASHGRAGARRAYLAVPFGLKLPS